MIPELDIWRAAALLIRLNGDKADSSQRNGRIRCSNEAIEPANLFGCGSAERSASYAPHRPGGRIEPGELVS
jgi:hypothetical protein